MQIVRTVSIVAPEQMRCVNHFDEFVWIGLALHHNFIDDARKRVRTANTFDVHVHEIVSNALSLQLVLANDESLQAAPNEISRS